MKPHNTASGIVSNSPLILIDVETDSDVTGHGLIFTFTPRALKPAASLVETIAPLLGGWTLRPEAVFNFLYQKFLLLGNQGLVMMALSGIDMAVWDAFCKLQQSSLLTLKSVIPKPLRVYGSIGLDGPSLSARQAESWLEMGFTGVKAKIGYPSLREDREVIRAIRSVVDKDTVIMVDYNQALSRKEAVYRLQALDEENLGWIEEPLDAQDLTGYTSLQKKIKTPLQAGENWWGPRSIENVLESIDPPLLMLDVMKVGGVSGWLETISLLKQKRLPLSSHLWPELSFQLLSLCENPHWLEYNDWWNPILQYPLVLQGGYVKAEGSLGLGMEWNEKEVLNYVV